MLIRADNLPEIKTLTPDSSYLYVGPEALPSQTLPAVLFTFLGEKLSAVLPSSDNFAWYLPKELHDQSDVVCPPPHTSQRGQARFSITACTHTSAQLAQGRTHTAARGLLRGLARRRTDKWTLIDYENPFKPIPCLSLNFKWESMFARVRRPRVPVPPALSPALPLLLKNSREYFPERAKCLGIQPSSSMMWAIWSIKGRDGGRGRGGIGRKRGKGHR